MPNMSGAIVRSFSASVSMSTSGSSVASETPDSEHTVSVLDFSYQYAAHLQQQQVLNNSVLCTLSRTAVDTSKLRCRDPAVYTLKQAEAMSGRQLPRGAPTSPLQPASL